MMNVEFLISLDRRLTEKEIALLRNAMKMSSVEIAKVLYISKKEFSKWEKGKLQVPEEIEARFRLEAIKRILGERQSSEINRKVLELYHDGFRAAK